MRIALFEQDGENHLVFFKKTSICYINNGIIVLNHALKSVQFNIWRT